MIWIPRKKYKTLVLKHNRHAGGILNEVWQSLKGLLTHWLMVCGCACCKTIRTHLFFSTCCCNALLFDLLFPQLLMTIIWTASSEFGTYRLCEQRRFRRACASAQSRQNLRCSLIQAVSQEEPSDRKPDSWPL